MPVRKDYFLISLNSKINTLHRPPHTSQKNWKLLHLHQTALECGEWAEGPTWVTRSLCATSAPASKMLGLVQETFCKMPWTTSLCLTSSSPGVFGNINQCQQSRGKAMLENSFNTVSHCFVWELKCCLPAGGSNSDFVSHFWNSHGQALQCCILWWLLNSSCQARGNPSCSEEVGVPASGRQETLVDGLEWEVPGRGSPGGFLLQLPFLLN